MSIQELTRGQTSRLSRLAWDSSEGLVAMQPALATQ